MSNRDPFARPPRARTAVHMEDRAVRAALRAVKVPVGRVTAAAGLDVAAALTFDLLVRYADFPLVPAVTEEPVDDLLTLLTKFDKSRLLRGWLRAWDARPTVPPEGRLMVASGAVTGFAVAYQSVEPPPRPHVVLGPVAGRPLYFEPLSAWCRGLQWVDE